MIDLELIHLRAEFLRRGTPSRAFCQYVKWQGLEQSMEAIAAHGAMPIITDVVWHPHMGRDAFSFAPEGPLGAGEPAVVFEVMGEDGETVIDLCAWSIEDPFRFATALERADIAGECWLTAGCHPDDVLRVHRTPLAWMKSGCDGVVILRRDYDASKFGQWWGRIAGEDQRHADELARVLCRPPVQPEMICFALERQAVRRVPLELQGIELQAMGIL